MATSIRSQRTPQVPAGSDHDAPGRLAVVQAFVNTVDLEAAAGDRLADPVSLTDWLRLHGLLLPGEPAATDDDLVRTIRLREALRDLLGANHDDVPPPVDAVAVIDDEAARCPSIVRFTAEGPTLEPVGSGVDAALAGLLTIVFDAMRDGSWRRLKACRSSTCRWALWDASRNRSGKWCDMAVCGNRTKVRTYRERHPDS